MTTIRKLIIPLLLGLVLVGCTPLIRAEQPIQTDFIVLESGQNLGQTFVARFDGLQGIALYLAPEPLAEGVLSVHLRANAEESLNLRSSSLDLQDVQSPGFYHFQFPPIEHSHGQYYYITVKLRGSGVVRVGTARGDTYWNGALYLNQVPQDAQAAFQLAYSQTLVMLGLLREGVTWLAWLALSVFLFVLPGWALLSLIWSHWTSLHWAEKLGLASGLSLALYPLFILWTDLISLHLGPLYAWLPPLVGLAVIAWRNRHRIFNFPSAIRSRRALTSSLSPIPYSLSSLPWADLTLLVVIGLIFAVRFWVIRNLEGPMWGDSYQHTMIAQLLVDNGGLFESWEPYVPYRSLTVHFGFPSAVAIFMWLTGLASPQATLIVGQIINGMAIVVLLPLAFRLSDGNRWAGAGALIIAGLFSPMPAFYVNWGRYAQLTGQVVLPVALWLLWDALEEDISRTPVGEGVSSSIKSKTLYKWFSMLFVAALALTGMTFNYFRTPFSYATFALALLIAWGLPSWKFDLRTWLSSVIKLVTIAGLALILFLPWYPRLTGGALDQAVQAGIANRPPIASVLDHYRIWLHLADYLPYVLQFVVLIAILWSLIRKRWEVISILLWIIFLTAYIAGRSIGLPGANLLQNFAILIGLYIPAGLVCGWLTGEVTNLILPWGKRNGKFIITIALILMALWGAWDQRTIPSPNAYSLITRPDLRAMAWIRENISPEALFLVEGFRIYTGWSAVGADAGWWISLLANRQNTMPPQYALINEVSSPPEYSKQVVDLVAFLENHPPTSTEALQKFCDWGITHVYIGQDQGKLGADVVQLFAPDDFLGNSAFDLVYRQDRIYIFALNTNQCEIHTSIRSWRRP